MRPLSLLSLLLVPLSCTFIVHDETAPDLPLIGGPPDQSSYVRMNRAPAKGEAYVQGKDGAIWLVIIEDPNDLHNLRITRPNVKEPPPPEEGYPIPSGRGTHFILTYRAFYFIEFDGGGREKTKVFMRSAGEPAPGTLLLMPPSPTVPNIYSFGSDDRFLYWVPSPSTKSFQIAYRSDGRILDYPIPKAFNPAKPPSLYFTYTADPKLILRDEKDHLWVYSSTNKVGEPIDLGVRPKSFAIGTRDQRLDLPAPGQPAKAREALLSFGMDGLRWVPLDGAKESILEPEAIRPEIFTYRYRPVTDSMPPISTYYVYYLVGDELRAVPLDVDRKPELVKKGGLARLYGFVPDNAPEKLRGKLFYTRDPANRYIYGVGDGWIDDLNFMERGRSPSFSRDGAKIRWLEHAALASGAGDLLVATVPGGAPLRLARNAAQFEELADGRVLALTNRAFVGTQNRLIVIEEEAQQARWVADATRSYMHIPESSDLIVNIITGPETHDLLRVPIPPPLRPRSDAGVDGKM